MATKDYVEIAKKLSAEQGEIITPEYLEALDNRTIEEWEQSQPASAEQREPTKELLVSMATRLRHDFPLLDELTQNAMLISMRQVWEETNGTGFYRWKVAQPASAAKPTDYFQKPVGTNSLLSAKPAEDGLEEQLRACIRYTAARLRDEHEDLEEDIYAAVLNFIHLELRDSIAASLEQSVKRVSEAFQQQEPKTGFWLKPFEVAREAIRASHWPAQKENKK